MHGHHHYAHPPLDYGSWFWFLLAMMTCAIALGYAVHTLISQNALYQRQRFGAIAITIGQGIFAWYWHGRIDTSLPPNLIQNAGFWLAWIVTGIGLVGLTQRQPSKTWLWF